MLTRAPLVLNYLLVIVRAYGITAVGLTAFTIASCMMGWVMFAYYRYCDPLSTHAIQSSDQVGKLIILINITAEGRQLPNNVYESSRGRGFREG